MTSQLHTCYASPHLPPTSRLFLLLHLPAIFLLAPTSPLRLSFQLVLKTAGRRKKFPLSEHQLAITPEELAISEQERGRWEAKVGQAPFYKHGEGREVRVQVSARVFLRGVRKEPKTVSFTQLTNTLIIQFPGRRRKHRGTTDAIILWNKNAK